MVMACMDLDAKLKLQLSFLAREGKIPVSYAHSVTVDLVVRVVRKDLMHQRVLLVEAHDSTPQVELHGIL
ncbi:hypothetical protein V6N12_013955 [Hibiscus sabdariffa]|uniref:Uncharacterized protein n=1 Tax=Hibiscus sabdariffa TaxID=183260 RepID=A0ABR2B1T3_9ROSI